jgi:hypothetical protein
MSKQSSHRIDNRGYTYIPGELLTQKRKSKIDNDKNWKRLPNQPKGYRF